MAKLVDRAQIIDASEQIIKLRGDSGALVVGRSTASLALVRALGCQLLAVRNATTVNLPQ